MAEKNIGLDLKLREDRIGKYFRKYLDEFVFVELSEKFLQNFKAEDIMRGVPVPFKKQDVKKEGISLSGIARNMAWVTGCDPHFKYAGSYCDFMDKVFGSRITEVLLNEGRAAEEEGNLDAACIYFRAGLCIKPDNSGGMYSYARCCTKMYEASTDAEYTGRMKAEALDFYELMTEIHPGHAQSYYYLGYAYLNMGYYIKAKLSWNEFLRLTEDDKDREEISYRLEQIEKPAYIEEGCNDVTAGRFGDAITKLEPFLEGEYGAWWPLHYFLGLAYEKTGRIKEAKERFMQVLRLNGSHIETMKELCGIFSDEGDSANAEKYMKKISIIRKQLEEEAEEINKKDE